MSSHDWLSSSPSSKKPPSPPPIVHEESKEEVKLQQEAGKAALDFVKNSSECKKEQECKKIDVQKIQSRYSLSGTTPLSEADLANGVKGRYFVSVTYIYRSKGSAEWSNGGDDLICTKTREVWKCQPSSKFQFFQ